MSIDPEHLKQLAHLTDDELRQLCEACEHLLERRGDYVVSLIDDDGVRRYDTFGYPFADNPAEARRYRNLDDAQKAVDLWEDINEETESQPRVEHHPQSGIYALPTQDRRRTFRLVVRSANK